MATNYQTQGTPILWKASGGDHVLTLTSLANGAGRKGDVHDFGANLPQFIRVEMKTKIASSPVLGKTVDIWWASSVDNSTFDALIAAGDAALSDVDLVYQMRPIGNLVLLANTNAQLQSFDFAIPARYGFPVIVNNSGQALSGTATDHAISIIPILGVIV